MNWFCILYLAASDLAVVLFQYWKCLFKILISFSILTSTSRFDVHHKCFFTPAIRSRIVNFILDRKRFTSGEEDEYDFGIDRLINDGVYMAAYPLHDVRGTTLNDSWWRLCVIFIIIILSSSGRNYDTGQRSSFAVHRMGKCIEVVSISAIGLCKRILWRQNWTVFCVVGILHVHVVVGLSRWIRLLFVRCLYSKTWHTEVKYCTLQY